jgi:CBS domain-containing protein
MLGKVCTKPVVVATSAMPVTEAARRMRARNVGALVVVNNRKPVGMLTDRDITVQVVARGKDPATLSVGAIMHRSPAVIRADAGILDAVRAFGRSGVRRLPVVSAAGRLVGIIALDDVLMLLGREMGLLAQGVARGLGRAAA